MPHNYVEERQKRLSEVFNSIIKTSKTDSAKLLLETKGAYSNRLKKTIEEALSENKEYVTIPTKHLLNVTDTDQAFTDFKARITRKHPSVKSIEIEEAKDTDKVTSNIILKLKQ